MSPLTGQFVQVYVEANSPDFQAYVRQFRKAQYATPELQIMRADGQELFSRSGALEGGPLRQALAASLSQAGKPLSDKQLADIARGFAEATKLQAQGSLGGAAAIVGRLGNSGSYAAAAVQLDQLGAQLFEVAKTRLQKADEQLGTDDEAAEGALALAEISRGFTKSPEIVKSVREITARHRDRKDLIDDAAALDRARAKEESAQTKAALQAYQQFAKGKADSPLAAFAQERIAALGGEVASTGGQGPAATQPANPLDGPAKPPTGRPTTPAVPTTPPAPAVQAEKAEGFLALATAFQKVRPEKCREYAQRVVQLVPGTDLARQAQELLK